MGTEDNLHQASDSLVMMLRSVRLAGGDLSQADAENLSETALAEVHQLIRSLDFTDAAGLGIYVIEVLTQAGYEHEPNTISLKLMTARAMAVFGKASALALLGSARFSAAATENVLLLARSEQFAGATHLHWGDPKVAVGLFENARRLFRSCGETTQVTVATSNLVASHCEVGDYAAALVEAEATLHALASGQVKDGGIDDLPLRLRWVYASNNHAWALIGLGRLEEAITQLHRARAWLDEDDDGLGRLYNERLLGMVAMRLEAYDEAVEHFRRSVATAREVKHPLEIEMSLFPLSEALEAAGDLQGALESLRQGQALMAPRLLALKHALSAATNTVVPQASQPSPAVERSLHVAAHDIRTPLSTIGLVLSEIGRVADKKRASHLADKGKKAIDTIEILLARMLNSIDATGRVHLRLERTNLASVVAEVVEGLRPLADSKTIGLDVNLCPVMVLSDRFLLTHILQNLLSNAVKYSYRGSMVEVTITESKGAATVTVKDWGVGIMPENLPLIFDQFGPLPGSRPTGGEESLGIGLRLASLQASVIGSRLQASSEGLGKGATFTLTLPYSDDGPSRLAELELHQGCSH